MSVADAGADADVDFDVGDADAVDDAWPLRALVAD